MSAPIVQMRRKAENLGAAATAIREVKPDTERIDTALGEPMLADEDIVVAVLAEMAEMVTRMEATVNHTADQVIASQDAEIKRLKERVEKLESAAEKPTPKSRKK